MGTDGIIYVGTEAGLCAVTNAGTTASNIWTFSAPAVNYVGIGAGGALYCAASDGVYAINPDGSRKWVYPVQGGTGGLAIGRDNTIYFEGYGYFLYVISDSGNLRWKSAMLLTDTAIYSSPVIAPDGSIYGIAVGTSALRPSLRRGRLNGCGAFLVKLGVR